MTVMAFAELFTKLNFLLLMTSDGFNLDTSHPLIYEIPNDGERGSYFGMSVAIRPKAASLKNSWSIQIGAPRGSVAGVNVREPGAVYRCHTHGPCRVFEVDRELAPSGGVGIYEFKEKKEGAWTGVSMDIKNFASHEETVVCGHRWINENLKNPESIDVTYLMTGVCYLQDFLNETFEAPVMRLLPLANKDKIYTPKPYVVDLSTYHWGLGQAGLSVRFSEGPSSLLIGAPGVTHWIGSVIKYESEFDFVVGNFARSELARKRRYTYLGYSVAYGRFYKDKEFWCATGAPRSANYRGEVFTFQFKESSENVRLESNLLGSTFGEYFGASLAAADINSDGFDDLIVGAPLFSSKDPDEGRIYVYLGTGRGYFFVGAQVVTGRAGQGRFGSCIASLADLDQDGYGDAAVGAPYEDDQRGVVYIYRGCAEGLHTDFSQRIRAQDIYPHLRGFGISISTPADADGNKYLDIAIGSHLSDHVVLLRSRPVISLHPQIKTDNMSLIDRKDSYVNVTVCSRYSGSNAPDHVDVTKIVEVDPVYGRGTFSLSKSSLLKKSMRLRPNEIICEINTVILNLSGKNFSPLQVTVRNEINPCQNGKGSSLLIKGEKISEEADVFRGACPMGSRAEASKEIPFAGVCGPDLICRSDLELKCDLPGFRSGFYTLDSSDVLLLAMSVKNHGEPAHHTRIKIWSNLKLNHRENDRQISSSSTNTYWVPVEGVLTETHRTHFSFQIDFEALKENDEQTHVNLIAEIFTSSLESNLQNNICKFSAKLKSDSVLSFYASSSIGNKYVGKETRQNQTLGVTHFYEVRKLGVTPLKDAQLTIYVPYHFKKHLLSFTTETSEWMQLSDDSGNKQVKTSKKSRTLVLDEGMEEKLFPPTNRTLFLNCTTPKNDCKVLKIFFPKGIPTEFSSYVKIILLLNTTAIDTVKDGKDIVHLSTSGTLKISRFLSKSPEKIERSASVSLYGEERRSRADGRLIALSVFTGGLLLSLIVTGLVKSNFFKRTKKQQLKALKDAEASFVYFGAGDGRGARECSTLTSHPPNKKFIF